MKLLTRLLGAAVSVALVTSSAAAQEAPDDWDLSQEGGSMLAYTTYDSGLSLGFRCQGRIFAAVAAGLPPSSETRRPLKLRFRDEEPLTSMWTTTTRDTVAVADYPAPLARDFREGGALRLTVPGGAEDGRDLTYAVELPASNHAIDAVLSACGRPTEDARDALLEPVEGGSLSGGLTWGRAPEVDFPNTAYASGFAVLTCLAWPDGRLRDCVVESEHPHDGRFGEAAIRGARNALVRFSEEAPQHPRMVGFYVGFRMPDDLTGRRVRR